MTDGKEDPLTFAECSLFCAICGAVCCVMACWVYSSLQNAKRKERNDSMNGMNE